MPWRTTSGTTSSRTRGSATRSGAAGAALPSLDLEEVGLGHLLAGADGLADRGDLVRRDRPGLVAPLLAHEGEDCGDLLVAPVVGGAGHLAEHRHGGRVEILALDVDVPLEAVEDDPDHALGRPVHPLGARERRVDPGHAHAALLVAGDADRLELGPSHREGGDLDNPGRRALRVLVEDERAVVARVPVEV